jgi:DegV family protein with EDD domain
VSKVGIVTDSSSCLPAELIREYGIRFAPVHLIIEGKDYRDRIDITPPEFWAMFDNLKTMPTTSAVSPGDFVSVFSELAKTNDSLVCIVVSKILSATYNAAEQAKEIVQSEYPGLNIEIVDSKNSIGAMGFIVLEAARAAQAGKSLDEVVKVAQDMVPKVKYVAALDTLKYLIHIGRAPKTAIIGEWLGVKPLIGIVKDTGLVDSLGRERGKQKSLRKLVDLVKNYTDTSQPMHVMIIYSNRIEEGEQLKEMVVTQYNCAEVYMAEFSPVAAAALGPVVGICFYS